MLDCSSLVCMQYFAPVAELPVYEVPLSTSNLKITALDAVAPVSASALKFLSSSSVAEMVTVGLVASFRIRYSADAVFLRRASSRGSGLVRCVTSCWPRRTSCRLRL